jgi:hydroxylaminobenzene mutase
MVGLPSRTKTIAFWLALYGTYVNWIVTTLAAIFGTAVLSPITGAGHSGLPWQEKFVDIAFQTVGIAIIACSVLVLGDFGGKR